MLNKIPHDNQSAQLKQIEKYFLESNSNDYQPDIFPLGYHVKRTEPRLIYVMPLTLIYEGESIAVKSKNFSATGLQVFMPRKLIIEGKTVQLTFDKFNQEHSTNAGEESAKFDSIDYLIKSVQHLEQKTYISLEQKNLSNVTIDFLIALSA